MNRKWPILIILLFILFQYCDVIFGAGSLSTFHYSPAAFPYHLKQHNSLLENTVFNRFAPQVTSHRAFWDGPLVYDPNVKTAHDELAAGEFPWLNPHLSLGVPLFANGIDSTFFIGNVLMHLFPPEYWDWSYLVLYVFTAICCFQLFSVYFKFGQIASLVGAIVFISSGLFPPQISYGGEVFNVHCFIWAVLAIEALNKAHGARRLVFLGWLGFVLSQSILAGMPEGSVATWVMVAIYLLIRYDFSARGSKVRFLKEGVIAYAIGGLICLPYLSTLAYYTTIMTHSHEVGHVTIPWWHLPEVFLPYFGGWVLDGFFADAFPNRLNVIFVGLFPVFSILALIARGDINSDRRLIYPFLAVIILYISQAYGSERFSLNIVGSIPVIKRIYFYRFFSPIFILSGAVISAYSIDLLLKKESSKKNLIVFLVLSALVLVFYGKHLYFVADIVASQKGAEAQARFFKWNEFTGGSILLLISIFGYLLWVGKEGITGSNRRWAGYVLIVSVLLYSNYNFSKSFFPRYDPFLETPEISFLRSKMEGGRQFRIYSPSLYFPSTSAGYGISDIRHMNPVVPESAIKVLRAVFGKYADGKVSWERFENLNNGGPELYRHPGFDLLNVKYFLFPVNDSTVPSGSDFKEVFKDERVVVIRNRNAKERYFFVDKVKVMPDDEILSKMQSSPELLLDTAFVSEEPIFPSSEGEATNIRDTIQKLRTTNHSYEFKINLTSSRFLVVTDAFYSGHTAKINAKPAKVYQTDGGLLGMALPSGNYKVSISYSPPYSAIAIAGSIVGILLLLILVVISTKEDRGKVATEKDNPF